MSPIRSAGRCLVLTIAFLASAQVSAQRYFFEQVGVDRGLPASKVYAVLQDGYGTVWIGTEAGLAAYDGRQVRSIGTQDGAAPGGARSLLLDRQGRLWVGHLDGGITVHDGDRFQAYTVGEGMPSAVTGLAEDVNGTIWLATAGSGAWRIPPVEDLPTTLAATRVGANELRDKLLGACALKDGRSCFVEDGGTILVTRDGTGFEPLDMPGIPQVFRFTALFQHSSGDLWVGTIGGGAFRLPANGAPTVRYDIPAGLGSETVFCFGEDARQRTWVGTLDGGLSCIDGDEVRTFDPRNGLHTSFVRCIGRDREGNLLIGTNDNGLDIFKGERFVSFGEPDGLADPRVWAVLEDRQGSTWFGTDNGIVVLGRKGSVDRTITVQDGQLTSNFIRSLKEDQNGRIWIGTDNGGLLQYDPRSGRAVPQTELSFTLAEQKVTALELGQPGELWVGGLNGVRRYIPGSGTVPTIYTVNEGLASDHVKGLFRDRDGAIWVGSTVGGISVIDNGVVHALDLGRAFTATCFTQDEAGRIWVGTEGQGILVLEGRKEVQRFTDQEGLLSNTIKALATDAQGHVWIGTNKGLNKWRPKKGGFIAFTERAGFTGIEVLPNAVAATGRGEVWFGTVNGATRVGSEAGRDEQIAPLVAIRGWKVNLEDHPVKERNKLDHTERNVRIAYGSVSLSDPDAVRYAYMLEGLDTDWQPITTTTDAYYPALPPNEYEFKVKAMDRTGDWSEPAALRFTVLPPWWQSWWFYTASAVFIGIVFFSYVKVRERQLRMRNMVLERKVEERTAEVVAQSREIEQQKGQIEGLLLNILPKPISDELQEKGSATARRHDHVSVMFTDFKGFTQVAERMTPEELVHELDECFIRFDDIVGRYGLEKIKTIGDSYMCAAGVPASDPQHALKTVLVAFEVRELMDDWKRQREAQGKMPWSLRIGVHSGPVVAGVVGKRKFAYDIWGDTVNTASRMESSGEPGEVNISGDTYAIIKDHFDCQYRGKVQAKKKGEIDMYFVKRIKPGFSTDAEGVHPNERFLRELGVSADAEQLA
ncbi:MAG: hypothetical protein KDB96_05475 [Flavobacteriales bacterium]|nr:hypothetical protein [Flavobacteriales bacterium]